MENIPYLNLTNVPNSISGQWNKALAKVINSGIYINGPMKTRFENSFSQEINSKFSVGVANGLDGLVLALQALGATSGTKVAVPEHTFIAPWIAIEMVGASPMCVPINSLGGMDLEFLENLTVKPDIVLIVHMHGIPADMSRVKKWASKHKVKILEDASQAHMAKVNDKYVGTWGDIGVFSLYPTKNLGALGDAGIVVTNNQKYYSFLRSASNYGLKKNSKYIHQILGRNSRLDEIQAALVNVNLKYIGSWNKKRAKLAKIYIELFTKHKIDFLNDKNSVYHHFIIYADSRESLRNKLQKKGIGTEIHYPYLASEEYELITNTPIRKPSLNALKFARNGISLPLHHWNNSAEIKYIAQEVINNYQYE